LTLSPTDTLNITVNVANVGKIVSKTVAAIYFSKPLSKFVRYHKMLGAFTKTPLIKAGGSATVTLAMPISAMSVYDPKAQDQRVEPGEYVLTLGQDSEVVEGTVTVITVA
jgi:beta-glucosidase